MPSHQAMGRVLRVDGARIWIETLPESGCEACATGRGCGALRWRSRRPAVFAVSAPGDGGVAAGDTVVVEIPVGALLRGALAQYLVPLTGLFAGALLASALAGGVSDLVSGLGAIAGLVSGLFAARALGARLARAGWLATKVSRAGDSGRDSMQIQLS